MHVWGDLGVTFHNIPADQKALLQICEERGAARPGGSGLGQGTRKDGLCKGQMDSGGEGTGWATGGRAQGSRTRHPSRVLDPEV